MTSSILFFCLAVLSVLLKSVVLVSADNNYVSSGASSSGVLDYPLTPQLLPGEHGYTITESNPAHFPSSYTTAVGSTGNQFNAMSMSPDCRYFWFTPRDQNRILKYDADNDAWTDDFVLTSPSNPHANHWTASVYDPVNELLWLLPGTQVSPITQGEIGRYDVNAKTYSTVSMSSIFPGIPSGAYNAAYVVNGKLWGIGFVRHEIFELTTADSSGLTAYDYDPVRDPSSPDSRHGYGFYDGEDRFYVPPWYAVNKIWVFNIQTASFETPIDLPSTGFATGSSTRVLRGGAFTGTMAYCLPSTDQNSMVKFAPSDTEATIVVTAWPADVDFSSAPFSGGIWDGTYIWLLPLNAERLVRLDPTNDGLVALGTPIPDSYKITQGGAAVDPKTRSLWIAPFGDASQGLRGLLRVRSIRTSTATESETEETSSQTRECTMTGFSPTSLGGSNPTSVPAGWIVNKANNKLYHSSGSASGGYVTQYDFPSMTNAVIISGSGSGTFQSGTPAALGGQNSILGNVPWSFLLSPDQSTLYAYVKNHYVYFKVDLATSLTDRIGGIVGTPGFTNGDLDTHEIHDFSGHADWHPDNGGGSHILLPQTRYIKLLAVGAPNTLSTFCGTGSGSGSDGICGAGATVYYNSLAVYANKWVIAAPISFGNYIGKISLETLVHTRIFGKDNNQPLSAGHSTRSNFYWRQIKDVYASPIDCYVYFTMDNTVHGLYALDFESETIHALYTEFPSILTVQSLNDGSLLVAQDGGGVYKTGTVTRSDLCFRNKCETGSITVTPANTVTPAETQSQSETITPVSTATSVLTATPPRGVSKTLLVPPTPAPPIVTTPAPSSGAVTAAPPSGSDSDVTTATSKLSSSHGNSFSALSASDDVGSSSSTTLDGRNSPPGDPQPVEGDDSNRGLITGIAVGAGVGGLACCFIPVIFCIYRKEKKKQQEEEDKKKKQEGQYPTEGSFVVVESVPVAESGPNTLPSGQPVSEEPNGGEGGGGVIYQVEKPPVKEENSFVAVATEEVSLNLAGSNTLTTTTSTATGGPFSRGGGTTTTLNTSTTVKSQGGPDTKANIQGIGVNDLQEATAGQGVNFAFQKGKVIGQGGFGKVYLARNESDVGLIAAKELLRKDESDDRLLRELAIEVNHMRRLNHPNIVKYLGFEHTADDEYFILMEYMAGGSLRSNIQNFGRINEGTAAKCTQEALFGLKYLHSENVVHRDIKAANMLLDTDGKLKLSDLGTAKHTHATQSFVGTPNWMSPEVCRVEVSRIGPPADIWALGCTVMEMLTGEIPWSWVPGLNTFTVMKMIGEAGDLFQKAMDQFKEMVGGTTAGYWFVRSCLELEPENRPTATQLLHHDFLKAAQFAGATAQRGGGQTPQQGAATTGLICRNRIPSSSAGSSSFGKSDNAFPLQLESNPSLLLTFSSHSQLPPQFSSKQFSSGSGDGSGVHNKSSSRQQARSYSEPPSTNLSDDPKTGQGSFFLQDQTSIEQGGNGDVETQSL